MDNPKYGISVALKSFVLVAANESTSISQHGTIEEILKHIDASKYAIPDDWLEPAERAEKRKQARLEAKLRKEARAKEEAKVKAETAKEEKKEAETKQEASDVAEESKTPAAKRERETDKGEDSEEELDETPPMYRQARGLFLKPEVWTPPCA